LDVALRKPSKPTEEGCPRDDEALDGELRKPSKPQLESEPLSPNSGIAARWHRRFEDGTIVVQRVRNLPRAEAERAAYEIVLVEFLNHNYPDTPSDRCAWCGLAEAGPGDLRPYGTDARGVAWLHPERCWKSWRDKRRADAVEVLRNIGITQPPLPHPVQPAPATADSSIANGADAVPAHQSGGQ
jgi:hypothetical protein